MRGVESPSPAALVSGEMEDGSGGKYSLYIVWCNGMSGRKSCELRDVSFVVLLEVQVDCRRFGARLGGTDPVTFLRGNSSVPLRGELRDTRQLAEATADLS